MLGIRENSSLLCGWNSEGLK
uniref:Uncharacterized protein n=1 Tax=Arundo donax TaxID=35708 RepID=A0A0A9C6M8_ARUDO